jgi:hypothetical protein
MIFPTHIFQLALSEIPFPFRIVVGILVLLYEMKMIRKIDADRSLVGLSRAA